MGSCSSYLLRGKDDVCSFNDVLPCDDKQEEFKITHNKIPTGDSQVQLRHSLRQINRLTRKPSKYSPSNQETKNSVDPIQHLNR